MSQSLVNLKKIEEIKVEKAKDLNEDVDDLVMEEFSGNNDHF